MDIETDGITGRQVKMLTEMARHGANHGFRKILPAEWRTFPGYPESGDYTVTNFERWIGRNLTKKTASAVIAAVSETNIDAAREILKSNGCPIV